MALKIKTLGQLRAEKKKLVARQNELENHFQTELEELKRTISPKIQLARLIAYLMNRKKRKERAEDLFADTVAEMAAKYARQFTVMAEEKFRNWFHHKS
ncbi:MAG: hypothetical protein GC171_15175 [Terrimonas sp.]|nr:hypothetical protein [Terrimonas sp.]